MKISVIIPTYKPQDYLWVCLSSLKNQTLSKNKYEIIIVLNGEKEPYYSQIQYYIRTNFASSYNVLLIYSDWGNVSNARNIGLDCAQGEFIAFVDDDDNVSPTYLEELLKVSDEYTIGLSYPYAFNDNSPEIQAKYSITEEYNKCAPRGRQDYIFPKKFFSGPCMKLIHRSIIDGRRFDTRFRNGEDSIFMFLISDKMKYVDFTTKGAIYYRRYRENSATSALNNNFVFSNCWKMFVEYNRIFLRHPCRYNFRRYVYALLGLGHIMLNKIMK